MKIKISEKDRSLLVVLAALVIMSIAYFGVYQGYSQKTAALREENTALEQKITILEGKVAHEADTIADTNEKNRMSKEILDKFPAAQTTQNAIYILDCLETIVDFEILSENFAMNVDFWQSTGLDPMLTADCSKVTISYETSYDGLKKALAYFEEYEDRIALSDISVAYNTVTGKLAGSMMLELYAVEGTDKIYTDPAVGNIRYGVDNILRTKK